MTTFHRKMSLQTSNNDNAAHYDCEACTWPGVGLPLDSRQQALEAFHSHNCSDYANVFEIQGKLTAF